MERRKKEELSGCISQVSKFLAIFIGGGVIIKSLLMGEVNMAIRGVIAVAIFLLLVKIGTMLWVKYS
ncbi:MAG: hypothetical protein QME40_00405 [bacterium]|nr:hypothetical protein [bacterium]